MVKKTHVFLKQFDLSLWVLALGWFVGAMGFAVAIPFISIYFSREIGLSLFQIGLFFGGLAIIRSTFQLIGGEYSDRVQRRYLLIYTQIIRGFAFLGMAISILNDLGFFWVAFFLILNSVFGAIFHPAANAMVSDILPKEKRLDGYAITRSAGNLGWAVGPAIGGYMAAYSYGYLFVVAAFITTISGVVFALFLKTPNIVTITDKFTFRDLIAIKDDKNLAIHSCLIFILYLVVAQLIATFSVYAVEIVGLSEHQLGIIYTINGLMVATAQLPITHLLHKKSFTFQLSIGAFIYAIGYGLIGMISAFKYFIVAIVIVTIGEMFMSPPSLALTSQLAPEGRMGRYMGIFSFFVSSGWSFGPMYGGFLLEHFSEQPIIAWIIISSLGIVAGAGYILFAKRLPAYLNKKA